MKTFLTTISVLAVLVSYRACGVETAKCASCFDGPCFNNGSCNSGCRCYKSGGEQTGFCGSVGYEPKVGK